MAVGTGLCACECGQTTAVSRWSSVIHGNERGKPRLYVHGHNRKIRDESIPETKRCPNCKRELPMEQFSLNPQHRYGRDAYCKLCVRKRSKEYRALNKARLSERQKELALQLKRTVFQAYGGPICSCCGEKEFFFLSMDHIEGGGNKHRKSIGRARIYRWLKAQNYPSGFQVLCFNCNLAKGFYGHCPHDIVNH